MKFDINGKTALHHAVENNILQGCKDLLKTKNSKLINSQDNLGETALMKAVLSGHPAMFEKLIDCKEMDTGISNNKGQNILHLMMNQNVPQWILEKLTPFVKIILSNSCQKLSPSCISCQNDKSMKLPLQYASEEKQREMARICLNHSTSCGGFQINQILKSVTNEEEFSETFLFKTILDTWKTEDPYSLIWYVTQHSKTYLLEKLILSTKQSSKKYENSVDKLEVEKSGIKESVKLSIQEHQSDCIRVFIKHGIDFDECLGMEEVAAYIQGANEADFDIVNKITESYKWQKIRSENGLDSILVQALKKYLGENVGILINNFKFVEDFNNEDLLKFALQKLSTRKRSEIGKNALENAMNLRLLNNLKVLLDDTSVPMNPKCYDVFICFVGI